LIEARPGSAVSFQASTLLAAGILLVESLRGILCRFTLLFAAEVIQCGRAAGRMLATMLLAALLPGLLALLSGLLALLVLGAGGITVLIGHATVLSNALSVFPLILSHLDLLNEVVGAQSYASERAQQAALRYRAAT
jgi:hypothetical protein